MRRKRVAWIGGGFAALVVVAVAGLVLLSWRRPELGFVAGRLLDCASPDNCVCSVASDPAAAVEPFHFEDDADAAWTRLVDLLRQQPNCRIVTNDGTYLHAEFSTPWLRFVDDAEFQLDAQSRLIQVRSASRVGRSDLGVNRRRVESLRGEWQTSSK
jgi:uncharacterized protein (DUF1499 family)